MIRREPPPPKALHAHYLLEGAYVDCYTTSIGRVVTHAEFVEAFYTTWLFKLERWILMWAVKKPSTDAGAREVARGQRQDFAAWTVEARADNQLVMCDFQNVTRSWFLVVPEAVGTKLYFGSVVTARKNPRTGERALGRTYRALMGFHQLYSRALLSAARSRLHRS